MQDINSYITSEAIGQIRKHIKEAGGNEVFLVGVVDDHRRVSSVEIYARGNEFSAPALLQVAGPGDVVIHNHPSGPLSPSGPDTQVASILGNDGIAFYIVDNAVTAIYAVIEPFDPKKEMPVQVEALVALFEPDGPFANKLENYEHRPQQIDMMLTVSRSINESKVALIEAGTGTGKTLAYLLPNIVFAINNKERIVVSTNTINLQEQLINKDLPFLKSVLDKPFSAVLVKGRSNYACRRKLLEATQELDLFSDDESVAELEDILAWSKTTRDGSKSDLNFVPRFEVWEKVQSESDTSLKAKCPHYQECFFYSARRKAAKANVLVANHHLLFSDLAVRAARGSSENAILPAYQRVVLDEAHNVEEVATSYFGVRVTYWGTQRMLRKLFRHDKGKEKGFLPYLAHRFAGLAHRVPDAEYLKLQNDLQDHGVVAIEKLHIAVSVLMERVFSEVMQRQNQTDGRETKLRLTPAILSEPEWQEAIQKPAEQVVGIIRRFTMKLYPILDKIEEFQSKIGRGAATLTLDLQAQLNRLNDVAKSVEHVLLEDGKDHVRWLEAKQGPKDKPIVRLVSSPLDVAPILKKAVFERFKNVILTSATLAVEGRFDFQKSRLGLDKLSGDRILEQMLGAPFDYKKQALIAIPTDLPNPHEPAFVAAITNLILTSIEISQGRAFVLFTSYGLLNKVYFALYNRIVGMGVNVYKQGKINRHQLLERFKEDVSSVLFATDSFWEGVDVHGEALESVIISKLPFRVPSEPIIEARVEAIERRGGNAFYEYTVPQAAIKFKQGFGRVIRRKSDRGSILILDKRVVQKSYGRTFLNSLPECRFSIGQTDEVVADLKEFYGATSVS